MRCDVLIVGGGPAGSSAAHACAAAGLDTVLVERKSEIGVPVSCSGAIGSYLIPLLPFKVPKELLTWKIESLDFYADHLAIRRSGGPWTSYAIDRTAFDLWLSRRAVDAGARLLLNTGLVDLDIGRDHMATKAVVDREGQREEIEFKVLIGADGTDSTVLERLGERDSSARVGRAVVYEYSGVNLTAPHSDQLYFGDFSPGGYAHVFPLSEDRANVGVGTIVESADINECFRMFLEIPAVREQLKGAVKVREKSGRVPFGHLSDRIQYGNVLLAGDAASQNIKPLVEGFLPAVICGDIAGKTAAAHLRKEAPLERYERNIALKLGPVFRESDRIIGLLERISDAPSDAGHLLIAGLCSNLLSADDVEELGGGGREAVERRFREWSKSRLKQGFLGLYEGAAIAYLHLRGWANSKIYKL
ncbi:MAG: NAD(P)/FAD-dependent oxidoreductase [Methanobacteriota archaeon]|nr:MAG: NAD(P)/FAD-dependent oxidoreductase [Euryarchaeota archaeon]